MPVTRGTAIELLLQHGMYQGNACVLSPAEALNMKNNDEDKFNSLADLYLYHRKHFLNVRFDELKTLSPTMIEAISWGMRKGASYEQAYLGAKVLPVLINELIKIKESRSGLSETEKVNKLKERIEVLLLPYCTSDEERQALQRNSHKFATQIWRMATIDGLDEATLLKKIYLLILAIIDDIREAISQNHTSKVFKDIGALQEVRIDDLRSLISERDSRKGYFNAEFYKDIRCFANLFGLKHTQMIGLKQEKNVSGQSIQDSITRMKEAFEDFVQHKRSIQGMNPDLITKLEIIQNLYHSCYVKLDKTLAAVQKVAADGKGAAYIAQSWYDSKGSHTIGFLITPDKVGILNRGDMTGIPIYAYTAGRVTEVHAPAPGIQWYNKPANIEDLIRNTLNSIDNSMHQYSNYGSNIYNRTSIENYQAFVEQLGRPIPGQVIRHSWQKAGNCTVASHDLLVKAAYIELTMQQAEEEYRQANNGQNMDANTRQTKQAEIIRTGHELYQDWQDFERKRAIDNLAQKYEGLQNTDPLLYDQYRQMLIMAALKELKVNENNRGNRAASGKARENYEKIRTVLNVTEVEMREMVQQYDRGQHDRRR